MPSGAGQEKVLKIPRESPLGWMLENWADCPQRRKLSKEKMVHYCTEGWGGKEIRHHVVWPVFGTFEPWVGKALNRFVAKEKPYDWEENIYAEVWEPRASLYPVKEWAPPPPPEGTAASRPALPVPDESRAHLVRKEEGEEGPSSMYPLREVPMATGVIGFVNVPINTSDVRAFKKEMGKLMGDPLGVAERLDEFLGTSIYNYEDLCLILRSLFNTEERDMIRRAAIREWERRNPQGERGEQKWPNVDPGWNPQSGDGRRNMMDLRNMIIQGVREAVPRGQNISKILGECQKRDESPSEWVERLRRGLQTYLGTDPDSPVGEVLLKTQFVAKSWEDIRRKLEKIENWQEKELQELLREAQKVYMRKEDKRNRSQARVMVAAVREAQRQDQNPGKGRANQTRGGQGKSQATANRSSPRTREDVECFYCKKGHFKKDCVKRIKDEQVFKED
uniref:Core shell protein Gag P30 domain-containing protein n=1 Tax=Cyanoderma ruficeps TaxID=181631 RepID=A0A8C3QNC9_9PASS